MSYTVKHELNFGEVMTTSYRYVNFCQGPDYYKFKLPKDQAMPFINTINNIESVLNTALKQLDEDFEEFSNGCFDETDDGYVEFCAFILGAVDVNDKYLSEGEAIDALDKINADTVGVVCSVVCDNEICDCDCLMLRLESIKTK